MHGEAPTPRLRQLRSPQRSEHWIGCLRNIALIAASPSWMKTKRNHEHGLKLVGGHVLKDSRRLGQARVTAITTAITDALYEKLSIVTDAEGNAIGERRTSVTMR
jgi:hypothetical protein